MHFEPKVGVSETGSRPAEGDMDPVAAGATVRSPPPTLEMMFPDDITLARPPAPHLPRDLSDLKAGSRKELKDQLEHLRGKTQAALVHDKTRLKAFVSRLAHLVGTDTVYGHDRANKKQDLEKIQLLLDHIDLADPIAELGVTRERSPKTPMPGETDNLGTAMYRTRRRTAKWEARRAMADEAIAFLEAKLTKSERVDPKLKNAVDARELGRDAKNTAQKAKVGAWSKPVVQGEIDRLEKEYTRLATSEHVPNKEPRVMPDGKQDIADSAEEYGNNLWLIEKSISDMRALHPETREVVAAPVEKPTALEVPKLTLSELPENPTLAQVKDSADEVVAFAHLNPTRLGLAQKRVIALTKQIEAMPGDNLELKAQLDATLKDLFAKSRAQRGLS